MGSSDERHSDNVEQIPQPGLPRFGPKEWTVSTSRVGTGFHVGPVQHMIGCGNWGLNPYHRKGIGNFCAQVWRMFSGAYLRREYPKSERALLKAIAECEVWCERENAEERAARTIFVRTAVRRELDAVSDRPTDG